MLNMPREIQKTAPGNKPLVPGAANATNVGILISPDKVSYADLFVKYSGYPFYGCASSYFLGLYQRPPLLCREREKNPGNAVPLRPGPLELA